MHAFTLTKETKDQMIVAIQDYYLREKQEEIGNIEAGFLLDFFMEKLAPTFYNQGIRDAHQFVSEKVEDLFELEKMD
ncbi:DUF2164 domain-containing protein [Gracilibacillus salinarum]|uniref:DUF2164 domain-containing protein n=1 Tax=Gracilibacillus salinarum TaxID=2932255 RepID=A0ABY4GK37_9BACI|nr:DUF2164 domain-containing protein [Gracilibacillus salinarum]UOQ84546.1 DUF2164 domain-containing protein [Gracilibacillus salinarum]